MDGRPLPTWTDEELKQAYRTLYQKADRWTPRERSWLEQIVLERARREQQRAWTDYQKQYRSS